MHDLATVDLVRSRMEVGYQEAMEALDQAEGDVVKALAILEESHGGLEKLQEQAKEGVKRGLSGDELSLVRWKLLGQVVAEAPVALVGVAAAAVAVLALLISSSTVETEYGQAAEVSEETPERPINLNSH